MTVQSGSGGIPVDFQPMSREEIERTMRFLLQQQAQFAADFERLSGKTENMGDAVIGLTGIVGHVTEHLGHVTDHLDRLTAAQAETAQQIKDMRQAMQETDARLTQHIGSVESHLNVVIEMFERHLREDHGRRPS